MNQNRNKLNFVCYRTQGKVMFSHASVILFTIGLMDTRSLLILVGYSVSPRSLTAWSVCTLLECLLVFVTTRNEAGARLYLLPANEVWGNVISLQASVCQQGGSTWPPWTDTPRADTPSGRPPGQTHPLGRHTPLGRHPPGQTPPWADTTPWADTPQADTLLGRHPPWDYIQPLPQD